MEFGFEPVCDRLRASFEPASVMEFGFYWPTTLILAGSSPWVDRDGHTDPVRRNTGQGTKPDNGLPKLLALSPSPHSTPHGDGDTQGLTHPHSTPAVRHTFRTW